MQNQFITSLTATATAWSDLVKETLETQAAHFKSAVDLVSKGAGADTATEITGVLAQASAAGLSASAKATRLAATHLQEAATAVNKLGLKVPAHQVLDTLQEHARKAPEAVATLLDQAAAALVPAKGARRAARA